jgi:hypothetical protein
MSKQTSVCFIASVVSTFVIVGLGILIAVMSSMTRANTGGISAVAGGVSANLFLFALVSFPILVIVLFLVFSRVFGPRG